MTRYRDVVSAARNHRVFSSTEGVGPAKLPGATMLTSDPPAHERLRRLVSDAFTPASVARLAPHIERLAPHIEKIAHELLDGVAEQAGFDLITDLAQPLPIRVIAGLLGVEAERQVEF